MTTTTVAPYPTVAAVMNRARSYVNDMFRGGQGRILTNTAPFTVEYLNGALEELQDKLGNNGVITLIKDNVILSPIPIITSPDPAARIRVSYTGTFDGTTWLKLPVLPEDLVAVKKIWQRQVGSNLPFNPMGQPTEGLPDQYPQNQWLTMWEYLTDEIVMLGATSVCEIRLRYELRQAAISPETNENEWTDVSIQVLSSTNAMAWLVATNYAIARGSVQADKAEQRAEKMMRYIVRKYTRRAQSVPYRRSGYDDDQMGGSSGNTAMPF